MLSYRYTNIWEYYMRMNWYNIKVIHKTYESTVSEKMHKSGRYARRKEIEPILRNMEKTIKNNKSYIKAIKKELEDIRQQFSSYGDEKYIHKSNNALKKIKSMLI